jgi:hypothetical protein
LIRTVRTDSEKGRDEVPKKERHSMKKPKELERFLKRNPDLKAVRDTHRADSFAVFRLFCVVCEDDVFVHATTREEAAFEVCDGIFSNRKMQMDSSEVVLKCGCWRKEYDTPDSYEVNW